MFVNIMYKSHGTRILSSAQAQISFSHEFYIISQNSFSHSLSMLENVVREPKLGLEICESMAHILLNLAAET